MFSDIVISQNLLIFMVITALWVLPWKGYALWKAANNKDKFWFVAILILNTLAILDIVYIFYLSRRAENKKNIGGETTSSNQHE